MLSTPPNPLSPQDSLAQSLQALARRGVQRSFEPGAILIREGDHGDSLYLLLSGRLRVHGAGGQAGSEVTFGFCEAGDYVGEMGLDGGARSASVTAVATSVCAVVNREALLDHLREDPAFALAMMGKVIRRIRATSCALRRIKPTLTD
jgi:CRP/FNR family transcriptional regulator, cyclic AMP receptor protein